MTRHSPQLSPAHTPVYPLCTPTVSAGRALLQSRCALERCTDLAVGSLPLGKALRATQESACSCVIESGSTAISSGGTMAKSELIQNAKFFDRLVDLVPAKYYHPSDQELVNTKYLKKNAKAAAKQAMKEQYKQNKRAKLNPDTAQTSLQIQRQKAERLQQSDDSDADDGEPAQLNQQNTAEQQPAQEQKPEPVKTLQLPTGTLTWNASQC